MVMVELKLDNSFDFLSDEYGALFARADATGFQSAVWLDGFYRQLAPHRSAEPLIVTLRDEGGLVGVIPLIRRRKSGLLLVESTDLGVSDYAAPVLGKEARDWLSSQRSLSNQLARAIGAHDIVRIQPILPEHVDVWQMLFGCAAEDADFSAHAVALKPPFDEWRERRLDRKLSGMVARKGKRWKKQHRVELERLQDPGAITLAIKNLARLRKGRFDGDPIQQDPVEHFYAEVAARGAANGVCETWMLTSDGEIAAILFGLTHQGTFCYLLIGADYDNHGRHSPGLQMYDWIIEDWMARGGTSFDFTIGDEPFKMQFGTSAKPMSRLLKANSLKGTAAMLLAGKKLRRGNG